MDGISVLRKETTESYLLLSLYEYITRVPFTNQKVSLYQALNLPTP